MLMKNHNVGSVPVVLDRDSMRVIGMITDRDIALRVIADQRDYYNTHVEDVMSKDIVLCRVDDNYNEVIDAMKEHQIRRIPVVDSKKQLCGIIALADVARQALAREEVGMVVEQISKPGTLHHNGRASTARYTTAGLLVAGGLGIGAGLIYLLDPRWARRATEAVRETVSQHVSH
jgi:signal-transduction protein with cAMP-binding, CBS, and nucleotidyltransferase domain